MIAHSSKRNAAWLNSGPATTPLEPDELRTSLLVIIAQLVRQALSSVMAQVIDPSLIEGRADLSSRSMTWSLSVATLRPPALANPFGLKTSGSTAASPNSARLIRALAWKGLSQSCGSLAPDPHLKINGAEQIDRSLVAAAHAPFPNLVEANKLRRRSAASALHSLLDLVGSPLSAK